MYQRGPSYWKLNEEILNNNTSLIREDLKNFYENESPSSYENFKHIFRDLLRFIQENKKRVDQKELNLLKYHENVLRDCIHSGKGPNPNLIEKYHLVLEHLQKFSKEKDFQIIEKFRKHSAIHSRVFPNFVVNGHQRTQLIQSREFKWIRTFIIRMKIFLINFESIFQIFFQIVLQQTPINY